MKNIPIKRIVNYLMQYYLHIFSMTLIDEKEIHSTAQNIFLKLLLEFKMINWYTLLHI